MLNYPTPHSHPQSLDTGSTPEAFAAREIELGTGTLTCTDHGSMAATRKIYNLAKAKGLTPILGVEAYFRDDNCPILEKHGIPKTGGDPAKGTPDTYAEYNKYYHLTVHCLDQEAYLTLVRLLSKADGRAERHGSERKPLFDWSDLEELGATNCVFTSGCLVGMVQRHLMAGKPAIAMAYYDKLRSITKPGNFYVEVFPHRCTHNWTDGVFVALENGKTERYYPGKTLRTNVGEVKAESLANTFKSGKHTHLVAVKNYYKWEEREPVGIKDVKYISDFVQNECTRFAPDGDLQLGSNNWMRAIAYNRKTPILVSDDSHFAVPEHKVVQDVRLAQGGGSWRFFGSYHRQTSEESYSYFRDHMGIDQSEFESWVQNNIEWGSRFKGFELKSEVSLPTKFYPSKTLEHTMGLIKKHGRMDWGNPAYVSRLQQEIKLLHRNGVIDLLPYFMIDEEVCGLYGQHGLLTGPGRGSAAGLLLTYLLGITHVDPLKYGLSLERFLTLDRIASDKVPDIAQDLPHRDLLVGEDGEGGWLKERFGDHYAQISVDTTLKLKSSIKDVARFRHGRVPEDVEELTKKMPVPPQGVADSDFVFGYESPDGEFVPGVIDTDPSIQEYIRKYPKDWELVKLALGLARAKGRHACGYIISNVPVQNIIPTTEVSGIRVTQFDSRDVEGAGGVKMDFLVITVLKTISDAIAIIQKRKLGKVLSHEDRFTLGGRAVPGHRVVPLGEEKHDIWDLPEDQNVFKDICEGRVETVFQFDAPAARAGLKEFDYYKPGTNRKALDSIEALAAFTALDRPGPLDAFVENEDGTRHNMLVEFARRARGEAPVGALPIFQQHLPETHGVMAFQEQLQKMYQLLTGCTGSEAEEFRSNVAKKKHDKIMKAYPFFVERAKEQLGEEGAKHVFEFFSSWGQYGFNKSHAVCYVSIAYACAFLKHHYPLEWWTAVLRNASKDKINEEYWKYCGHLIDHPDVKLSTDNFEIVNERIRAPLSLLHGVGETAHKELVRLASKVTDIQSFVMAIEEDREARTSKSEKTGKQIKGRSALNSRIIYSLIISGAMDSLFSHDSTVLEQLQGYEVAKAAIESIGKKKAKKPKPVDPVYVNMDAATRYQVRKGVLPAYSAKILPLLAGMEGLDLDHSSFSWLDPRNEERHVLTVAKTKTIDKAEQHTPWPDNFRMLVAVPAYVVEDERRQYGPAKNKTMAKLSVDVDGSRYTFVKWPSKDGKLPDHLSKNLKGSLVMLVLSKWSDRPFAIEDIVVGKGPFTTKTEEQEEE